MKRFFTVAVLCISAAALQVGPAAASDESEYGHAVEFGQPVFPGQGEVGASVESDAGLTPEVTTLAGGQCASGNVCFWKQIDFDGERVQCHPLICGVNSWLFLGDYDRSAKNRFGNRLVRIGDNQGGIVDVLRCLNPGDNDRNLPLRADVFKIGQIDSRCNS